MSKYMFRRYLLFVVSLFINAFGIAFITKALLGTSPHLCAKYVYSLYDGSLDYSAKPFVCGAGIVLDDTERLERGFAHVSASDSRFVLFRTVHRFFYDDAFLAYTGIVCFAGGGLADRLYHSGVGYCFGGQGKCCHDGGRVFREGYYPQIPGRFRLCEIGL